MAVPTAFLHPKSTLRLVLYGFGIVALPLILSLAYATLRVDQLANQSQDAVYRAVQAIQNSQILTAQVTSLERAARQFIILGDDSLRQAYLLEHQKLYTTALRLQQLALDEQHRTQINDLIAVEASLLDVLERDGWRGADNPILADSFAMLTDLAEAILVGSNRFIDQEVLAMQESASNAQRLLFWFVVSLIPLSLLSAGVFTVLISRPIHQVDQAIRQLGNEDFATTITVNGPQDLQYLGYRLDWLRQRLVELQEQKARFLRHVSHELKTPLTAIREGAELLSENIVGPLNEQQTEITTILRDNTLRLQRLIEDLLRFGTAQEQRPELTQLSVDMKKLLEEVANSHKPTILAKAITLDINAVPLRIVGDESQLRTVIDNLISNAVKFTPEEGTIKVALQEVDDSVVLDVQDSGPGIAEEYRDKVFDAFFQGPQQTRSYVKGSGLGLSIAREYVHAHHGTIQVVESEQQAGAHLRVNLPLTGAERSDNL